MDEFDETDVEELEDEIIPPERFSFLGLMSDWLDNTGKLIEQFAEYPYALCRRVYGHVKYKRGRELDMAEAAREIERIEQFANGDKNA